MSVPTPLTGLEGHANPDVRNILGVDVCVVSRNAAFHEIEQVINNHGHQKFAFLNAHGANIASKDEDYRTALRNFRIFSDGIGVDLGSKVLYGEKFPANLNGTDFIPDLFDYLQTPRSVGLLGAEKGIAEQAAANFKASYPRHSFTVISDGYFDAESEISVLKKMTEVKPDILLVALGNPRQELWVSANCTAEHAAVPIGVGALFDFVAGRVPRAPDWMIRMRIEWLYRLGLEPARMWRRYILGNPLFMLRILKQKFFGLGAEWREQS